MDSNYSLVATDWTKSFEWLFYQALASSPFVYVLLCGYVLRDVCIDINWLVDWLASTFFHRALVIPLLKTPYITNAAIAPLPVNSVKPGLERPHQLQILSLVCSDKSAFNKAYKNICLSHILHLHPWRIQLAWRPLWLSTLLRLCPWTWRMPRCSYWVTGVITTYSSHPVFFPSFIRARLLGALSAL